ncbi:hypothetical protein V496_07230 [Pseudogymnoascus sp. VKM F-4515 (FW-2607)]|nr:hypothetical protein V496_07230 [Pseudogymnoascus sp. VKM F-4515 (FW-2607)]KFY80255.1 hypothetical protein V498_08822 [Pseudogymnoascus sp. VKM F-4517 (FW-2822)]
MKFTDTFRSRDGLEEYEMDDLENTITSLTHTSTQIESKKGKGRDTRRDEREVDKGTRDALKIVIQWAQRPQPSGAKHPLELDDDSRCLIRKALVLADSRDGTTAALCDELLQVVLQIASSLGIEIGIPDLDAEMTSEIGSSESENDPFRNTAYKPVEYSLDDLVDWDEDANEKMEAEMDVHGGFMVGDNKDDEDILAELEWPHATQDA